MWKGSWRLGRERKPSKNKKDSDLPSINNNNSKSNNINSKIEGDTITKITVINLQSVFPGMHVEGSSNQTNVASSSVVVTEDSGSKTPSQRTSFVPNDNDISSTSTTKDIESEKAYTNVAAMPRNIMSHQDSKSDLFVHSRTGSTAQSIDNQSFFSGGEYPLPKAITSEQMKKHIPKHTSKYIQIYMSTMLFGSDRIIPLWNPSPNIKKNPQAWRHHVNIGDIGIFNDQGGFDTLFNIFLSTAQNHERGYKPPESFVPYDQHVNIDFQDVMLTPSKLLKFRGLIPNFPPNESCRIGSSYDVDSTQCAALYLHSGYLSATLNQWERPGVLQYIRGHQESWQLHLEHRFSGQLQDRPLLIIFSSFRTKSCALAAGYKPNLLKSWKAKLTLGELVKGKQRSYILEADNENIYTQFSPSHAFIESLEAFFTDLGANCSAEERKEIEECHCIAVGAYGLQKRGWIKGRSVITGRSSRTIVKPTRSRMSLPVHFNPSIREEIGH